MANNSQSRKWVLTINNPLECNLTHEAITEIAMQFSPDYFCMADEIAKTGTFHTHLFLYSKSPIRFNTIKNRYPTAHIEKGLGTSKENRNYITKTGKWENDAKAETTVEGSFFEYGTLPEEKAEDNPLMCGLINSIKDGKRTGEIVDDMPELVFHVRDIDNLRHALLPEQYANESRHVRTTYIFGPSSIDKIKKIYESHSAIDICRVTNYRKDKGVSFDNYNLNDVLLFDMFNSQIPIEDMLVYLGSYPFYLPSRYQDRLARYNHVYIVSHLGLGEQYRYAQEKQPEVWSTFLEHIHKVIEYHQDGTVTKTNLTEIVGGNDNEEKL